MKAGDQAPDFEGPISDGSRLGLKDFVGKKNVVLYFYPKDDTPGCTKEACSFRDNLQPIRDMGAEIIGVSLDSIQSHSRFASKYGLPFPLISDKEKRIANAYGVLKDTGYIRKPRNIHHRQVRESCESIPESRRNKAYRRSCRPL